MQSFDLEKVLQEQYFKAIQKQVSDKGLGVDPKAFLKEDMKEIHIEAGIKENLVYPDIQILANEDIYVYRRNGHTIYHGHIDEEGIHDTIVNDIAQMPFAINALIILASLDSHKIEELIITDNAIARFVEEMSAGISKGKENKHY